MQYLVRVSVDGSDAMNELCDEDAMINRYQQVMDNNQETSERAEIRVWAMTGSILFDPVRLYLARNNDGSFRLTNDMGHEYARFFPKS